MKTSELVRNYLSSFESADPEQIVTYVSEAFENDQVGLLAERFSGRELYREKLSDFLTTFKPIKYDIEVLVESEDHVAVAYTMLTRQNQQDIKIRGTMILFIRDNLIYKRSDYWDGLTYLRQLMTGI